MENYIIFSNMTKRYREFNFDIDNENKGELIIQANDNYDFEKLLDNCNQNIKVSVFNDDISMKEEILVFNLMGGNLINLNNKTGTFVFSVFKSSK
ncbi:hypothetical protein [Mammaliicoccus sciuri]|uniref:hypothetical protein n=1 Tax=Mammaliicoccus sciuri TaxID=1296 RepID=UPI002DBFDFD6|nr:hypothetical protein [Mammaliicoccus sciuri]MEB6258264.1 hypothetical protein [Mammaliicoccus sciuri]MEB8190111.1 hypothetical protein [Mammaliicoccus sciuri]